MTASPDLELLKSKIDRKTARVSIVGLGYVGLAVACEFARVGFSVTGVDIDEARVTTINRGECPIEGEEPGLPELLRNVVASGQMKATIDYQDIQDVDIVLICVDTPVDEDHKPRYGALRSAARSIGGVLRPDMLVIVESTVSPGTTNNVVRPILEEQSGLRSGADFSVGACPERVMPGKLLNNLRTVSRVCGGNSPDVADTMRTLYRHVVQAELDAADVVTAELVKTAENAYRDVQIAFANEVALVCEANGADVWQVRELVNKSPGRHMLLPGAGVGGHCIPKDPWLLAASAPEGAPLQLVPTARSVNDSMPSHVADLVRVALESAGRSLTGSKIAVLGFAYLENSDDTRNSPSADLVRLLTDSGADVVIHDPWIKDFQGSLLDTASGADAVVVMVRHAWYSTERISELAKELRTRILVDGRAAFSPDRALAAGYHYVRLGLSPQTVHPNHMSTTDVPGGRS